MGQVNCRKHYLSLRKSLVLYIIAFVVLAVFLSVTTFSICGSAAEGIRASYPPSGEKYYLTNEQGEQLGDGAYIGTVPVPMSKEDERTIALLEKLPIVATPIYSAFCIIAAALLFYRNRLKKPLVELRTASEKIANNDLDFSIDYDNNDELGQLCASFEIMRTTLADNFSKMWRQVEERKALNAAFAHDLRTPLTVLKGYNEMMNDFAPTHDLHGLNAMYLYQNATQSAAFSRFSDKEGNWNGLSVSDVFGNEEIKIGYVDGWLSTSKNMVRVFIVLALAVIIMLAPIFSGEYEGVDNIILTSKYGKTKCATAKVAAGILTAILTTALVAAFNLLLALIFYGTEGLDCSILFAPSDYAEGFIPFNITCGTLLKYQILLAFTCTLSVTGITLLISAISKNQIVAFVASMAIFLFPVLLPITEANPLFRLIGLLPLYHVQAVSLLSVEQMSNGMLYAVWAIPTALLFLGIGAVISRRVFAKHQVS